MASSSLFNFFKQVVATGAELLVSCMRPLDQLRSQLGFSVVVRVGKTVGEGRGP